MAEYIIQDITLTAIADAIREKTGETAALTPAAMSEAIKGIKILDVGSVTPTEDTNVSNYGIAHGLGATPDFFILIASGHFTNGEYKDYVKYSSSFKCSYEAGLQSYKVHRVYGYGDTNGLISTNGTAFNISDAFDSNKFYLKLPPYVKLKAGITYCWAVGVIDTLE